MTTDFTALLKKPVQSVERPKPLPIGSYLVQFTKFEFGESSKKKTPYVRFIGQVLEPKQDVDQQLLQAVEDWQGREVDADFFLTGPAMFRLREFLENSLKLDMSNHTFETAIPLVPGKRAIAALIQEPSTKPNDPAIYNRTSGWAAEG